MSKEFDSFAKAKSDPSIDKLEEGAKSPIGILTANHVGDLTHPTEAARQLTPTLTPSQRRKLLLKLDCTILPVCWLLYFCNSLDRVGIGNAGAYGFRQDVDAGGNVFNIGVTVFYIMYFLVDVPSNLAMKHFGAHIWLPLMAVGFGVVTLSTTFISTRPQFYSLRFLLGIFEGPTLPGCIYTLSLFYPKEDFTYRMGVFLTSAAFSSALGSLLATAYVNLGTITSQVYGWRNIFFLNSMITFAAALIGFVVLAKEPRRFRLLTEVEKAYIMGKSAQSTAGRITAEHTHKKLVWQGILNPTTWFVIIPWMCASVLAGSLSYFLPEILTGFGWSGNKANIQLSYTHFASVGWIVLLAYGSHKTKHHASFIIINEMVGIVGFSMFAYGGNLNVRYGGTFLSAFSMYGSTAIIGSWVGANAQPFTVRSAALGFGCGVGILGGIVGSWVFIAKEAPHYRTGVALVYTFNILGIIMNVLHWLYVRWENKQRDLGKRDWRLQMDPEDVALLGNLHPNFRYTA